MPAEEAKKPAESMGRYVLHDEIASGGMASVHLGRLLGPAGFSRTVAIKRLHPEHARDPEFVAMFLDEARLAARIRHPNVVPIIDVVALEGQLFLVMEYIQGESLSRLMRAAVEAKKPVPLPVALTILTDALYGLHAAHEACDEHGQPLSIVHRDVSPHNILVGKDGVARVLDFGIAKAASRASTTQAGRVKGKVAYMAPEQLQRGPVDRRADVFAATIIFWEVLVGERLFASDDLAGIVALVLNAPIDPPSTRVHSLPRELDAIVMRGLERRLPGRYATAMEMAKAIEAFGGLARPAEVGAWVDSISGAVLKKRAEQVQEIESSDSMGSVPILPLPLGDLAGVPFIAQGPRVSEPTMQLEEPEGLTESMHGDYAREDSIEVSAFHAVPLSASPAEVVPAVELAPTVELTRPKNRARPRYGIIAALLVFAVVAGLGFGMSTSETHAPVVSIEAPPPEPAEPADPVEPAKAAPEPSASTSPKPSAPKSPKSARPKLRRTAAVKTAPKPDCSPNYYFDADGIKRFKPECI